MEDAFSTPRLLVLRKLTREVADVLLGQLKDHLTSLMPLLKPRAVLGSYVAGAPKESARGADRAFKDLQEAYGAVCGSKPFNLSRELRAPLPVEGSVLELVPFEYPHVARSKKQSKTVTITSPLKWILYYSGYSPSRLREVLTDPDAGGSELQEFVLNHLALHVAVMKQRGLPQLFEALRFPVSSQQLAEFGSLPLTVVSSAIPTVRPSDERIIESTEISGSDEFEEVVSVEEIEKMRDPLKERLLSVVGSHAEGLRK